MPTACDSLGLSWSVAIHFLSDVGRWRGLGGERRRGARPPGRL